MKKYGTVEDFLTHGDNKHAVAYRAAVTLAIAQIDTAPIQNKP